MNITKRGIASVKLLFADPVFQFARYHGLNSDDLIYNKTLNIVQLKKIGLEFPNNTRWYYLISRYQNLSELKEKLKATFIFDNDKVLIRFHDLELEVHCEQDLLIVTEIFVDGIYNFDFPNDCVVVDIGFNVGYGSLYMAGIKNVKKIFSYEPLKPTFDQAKNNLARNPERAKRIQPNNYGISDKEKTLSIDYNFDYKADVGTAGMAPHVLDRKINFVKEQIQLKPIAEVFNLINNEYSNYPIILKVDCEGDEYNIMPTLAAHPDFAKVKMLMMEWHVKGPDSIIEILTNNGFICYSFDPQKPFGKIYATRSNAS